MAKRKRGIGFDSTPRHYRLSVTQCWPHLFTDRLESCTGAMCQLNQGRITHVDNPLFTEKKTEKTSSIKVYVMVFEIFFRL